MKFISNWFRSKVRSALKEDADCPPTEQIAKSRDRDRFRSPGIQFTLYKANGGFVVECQPRYIYDNKIRASDEEPDNRLHIITPDQNLGDALSQIFTYEIIRK